MMFSALQRANTINYSAGRIVRQVPTAFIYFFRLVFGFGLNYEFINPFAIG